MNRQRIRLLVAMSLAVLACGPAASGQGSIVAMSSAAAPASVAGSTPEPSSASGPRSSPSPLVHADTFTVDASIGYAGFLDWATSWGGIALVEVSGLGPVRWTTKSGMRPAESLLHTAPVGHEDTDGIGRIIEVRRLKMVSGNWLGATDVARYWRVGGKIGGDEMINELQLPAFSPGEQALAFLLPEQASLGAGKDLAVEVGWLFPVDPSGRVITLDPNENVTLENLASFLP